MPKEVFSNASVVNAATRLVGCLAQPGDAELLDPRVVEEILIPLLRSRIGARVAQMGFAESSVHRKRQGGSCCPP